MRTGSARRPRVVDQDVGYNKAALITGILSLLIGIGIGFALGVASVKEVRKALESLEVSEEPADLADPGVVETERVRFEYPGNWNLNGSVEDFAKYGFLSIDSIDASTLYLYMEDEDVEPHARVSAKREEHMRMLTNVKSEPFDRWGSFRGTGVRLRGSMVGLDAEYRIFSVRTESGAFTVVEETWRDDLAQVQPGFEHIRKTFTLK
jgi:hypothetical protein